MLECWQTWLAKYEIWPLAIGAILASLSLRTAPWGLGLLVIVWGLRWFRDGSLTVRTPLDWPVGVLLCMAVVTLLITIDRSATFLAVSRLLAGLAFTYGIINWGQSDARLSLLVLGLIFVGLLLSLVTPLVIPYQPGRLNFIPRSLYEKLPHPLSNLLNPNMVAGVLVMLLPFSLVGWLVKLEHWPAIEVGLIPGFMRRMLDNTIVRMLVSILSSLCIVAALLLTQSRGGWLAAMSAIFVILIVRSRYYLFLAVLPLVALGGVYLHGDLPVLLDALSSGESISGWPQRVEIWSRALYMVQDFSWTGIGAGTYSKLVQRLYPFFLVSSDVQIPHAHNLFLQVAVDLGVPGLISFVAIVLIAVLEGIKHLGFVFGQDTQFASGVVCACLASLVAMLVHGTVDATTWIVGWTALVPFGILGVLISSEVEY